MFVGAVGVRRCRRCRGRPSVPSPSDATSTSVSFRIKARTSIRDAFAMRRPDGRRGVTISKMVIHVRLTEARTAGAAARARFRVGNRARRWSETSCLPGIRGTLPAHPGDLMILMKNVPGP